MATHNRSHQLTCCAAAHSGGTARSVTTAADKTATSQTQTNLYKRKSGVLHTPAVTALSADTTETTKLITTFFQPPLHLPNPHTRLPLLTAISNPYIFLFSMCKTLQLGALFFMFKSLNLDPLPPHLIHFLYAKAT